MWGPVLRTACSQQAGYPRAGQATAVLAMGGLTYGAIEAGAAGFPRHASRHRVCGGGCGSRRDGRKAASAPTVSNATLPSNTPPTPHPPADPADSDTQNDPICALHPVIAESHHPPRLGGSVRVLEELLDHAVSCGLAVVGYATGRGRSRSALNNGVHALAACASLFRRVHDSCDLAKQLRQIR
jgi:hypothetical protein